jgi:hypothetical protein
MYILFHIINILFKARGTPVEDHWTTPQLVFIPTQPSLLICFYGVLQIIIIVTSWSLHRLIFLLYLNSNRKQIFFVCVTQSKRGLGYDRIQIT